MSRKFDSGKNTNFSLKIMQGPDGGMEGHIDLSTADLRFRDETRARSKNRP